MNVLRLSPLFFVIAAPLAQAQTPASEATTLEGTMAREFAKPEVRSQIGWTEAQERLLSERTAHNLTVRSAFDARVADLSKGHPSDEAVRRAAQEKGYDLSRIEGDAPVLLTSIQLARLKGVALLNGGASLYGDPEVAGRLGLLPDQRALGAALSLSPTQKARLARLIHDPAAWLERYSYRTVGRPSVRAERSEATLENGGRRIRAITYWQEDGTVVRMLRLPSTDSQASPEYEVTVDPTGHALISV